MIYTTPSENDNSECDNDIDLYQRHFKDMIERFMARPELMDDCLIKIYTVMKEYPPARNENKFLYGKLIEKTLIYFFNMIVPCRELDAGITNGAVYMNDVHFIEYDMCCSIKMSKNVSDVVLINKRSSDTHSLVGARFIICILKNHCVYFVVHTRELDEFVKQNGAMISYRSRIFRHLDRYRQDMILRFPCGDIFQSFRERIYHSIQERHIYEEEFRRLMGNDALIIVDA